MLLWTSAARGGQDAPAGASSNSSQSEPPEKAARSAAPDATAIVTGRIVDLTGVAVAGATITLSSSQLSAQAVEQQTISDGDGQFTFSHAPAGAFELTISAPGFAPQKILLTAQPGQSLSVPLVTLQLASVMTEVRVTPPTFEIAEAQIREEEKQKALGFIPNYYVTYIQNAAPLAPKQKFELAWKTMIDPVTFGIVGATAGIQQAQNDFSGYGQGADGYAKRYGAAYADSAIGTFIGGAILPSLWHQDPRYFYRGTGTRKSRLMYAIANAVICKGDNGKWQVNYSGLVGGLAAGGISNLYYPKKDRDVGLTFQNFAIGIGGTAAANILQEFVVKKLTPNLPDHDPSNGGSGSSKAHDLVGKVLISFTSMIREGD